MGCAQRKSEDLTNPRSGHYPVANDENGGYSQKRVHAAHNPEVWTPWNMTMPDSVNCRDPFCATRYSSNRRWRPILMRKSKFWKLKRLCKPSPRSITVFFSSFVLVACFERDIRHFWRAIVFLFIKLRSGTVSVCDLTGWESAMLCEKVVFSLKYRKL